MVSQSLTIDVAGSPMPAYLARPDDDGRPRPAVIVLQEIFGVNTEVRRITDLVAGAGYVGLAINYYHRTDPDLDLPYTPAGFQAGFKAAGKVNRETLLHDVGAAIAWLDGQPFVQPGHVATWGFCFGGTVAFLSATLPGVCAAVCFYGGSIAAPMASGEPEALADAGRIRCPVLLVYGGKDAHIGPAEIERTREALAKAHKQFEVVVYPDQDHAFFRNSGAQLSAGAERTTGPGANDVADAWERVRTFLKEHCG